jgi:hypothetical protein
MVPTVSIAWLWCVLCLCGGGMRGACVSCTQNGCLPDVSPGGGSRVLQAGRPLAMVDALSFSKALAPLLINRRCRSLSPPRSPSCGHTPVALVGGATGRVGAVTARDVGGRQVAATTELIACYMFVCEATRSPPGRGSRFALWAVGRARGRPPCATPSPASSWTIPRPPAPR